MGEHSPLIVLWEIGLAIAIPLGVAVALTLLMSPGLMTPGLMTPGLMTPGLTSPGGHFEPDGGASFARAAATSAE